LAEEVKDRSTSKIEEEEKDGLKHIKDREKK